MVEFCPLWDASVHISLSSRSLRNAIFAFIVASVPATKAQTIWTGPNTNYTHSASAAANPTVAARYLSEDFSRQGRLAGATASLRPTHGRLGELYQVNIGGREFIQTALGGWKRRGSRRRQHERFSYFCISAAAWYSRKVKRPAARATKSAAARSSADTGRSAPDPVHW